MQPLDYSIGELADAADLSRRAVRFYVQRELLPPPRGRGRGARYGAEHLARLRDIQELQRAGRSLEEIREAFAPPPDRPRSRPSDAPAAPAPSPTGDRRDTADDREWNATAAVPDPVEPSHPPGSRGFASAESAAFAPGPIAAAARDADTGALAADLRQAGATAWLRIPLADGVELHLDPARAPLDVAQVRAVRDLVRRQLASRPHSAPGSTATTGEHR